VDESTVRRFAEDHGAAIVAGDIERAMADLTDEVRGYLASIAAAFPQPTTRSEVDVSIQPREDDSMVVLVRYAGEDTQSFTVRSVWKQIGDRPIVVEAALATAAVTITGL
jgi:hypothetical protein